MPEGAAYRCVWRPRTSVHGHPALVFDGEGRLDLPLISFVREAQRRLSANSVRVYLYALLPFLTFLDRQSVARSELPGWNTTPERVRALCAQYLEDEMRCIVRPHRLGFELVSTTAGSRTDVGIFLASGRLFFNVMREIGCYAEVNPLVDIDVACERPREPEDQRDGPPTMPDISGVVAPAARRRLTDSFFKLVGRDWVPQIIDDPTFPVAILTGGRKLPGWGIREECITRLLFETGGRIHEITGLTLGDWKNRGLTKEVTAASKGSHGKRVKFFRFSSETATLLRRYFDGERRSHDRRGWTLADYIDRCDTKMINASEVPLFLSARGTPLSDRSYRETYWAPACREAALDADPHQARHWYVTMAVRTIHETSSTEGEIRRRTRELIEYMHWRGGEQTMAAYDHYFDAARHADIQDQLHERLRLALAEGLKRRGLRRVSPSLSSFGPRANDPDLSFLRSLGGSNA